MKPNKALNIFLLITHVIIFSRCSKFLDEKPDKTLKIPTTIQDLQSILDDSYYLNSQMPTYALASCDDYYLTEGTFNSMTASIRNAYTWQNYHYTNFPNDWLYAYNVVNVSNNVLETATLITESEQNKKELNNIIGSALFLRSLALYNGLVIYCKAYDPATAGSDPGMVLKQTSSVDEKSERASVELTCRKILGDLETATNLLPDLPQHKIRPSKVAAETLLSRMFLYMHKFDSAALYASKALSIQDKLMDYNNLDVNGWHAFFVFNDEVIFHAEVSNGEYGCVDVYYARIDSGLYNMYDEHDLRKKAFFENASDGYAFKGTYNNSKYDIYQGITTDELYLMRGEAYARTGEVGRAMEDLNYLMLHRWEKGYFIPFQATDAREALEIILAERRKELVYRGLRWMDIKRLNQEGAGINLKRNIGSQSYELQAGSPYFALPLPEDLIQISGIEQNKY